MDQILQRFELINSSLITPKMQLQDKLKHIQTIAESECASIQEEGFIDLLVKLKHKIQADKSTTDPLSNQTLFLHIFLSKLIVEKQVDYRTRHMSESVMKFLTLMLMIHTRLSEDKEVELGQMSEGEGVEEEVKGSTEVMEGVVDQETIDQQNERVAISVLEILIRDAYKLLLKEREEKPLVAVMAEIAHQENEGLKFIEYTLEYISSQVNEFTNKLLTRTGGQADIKFLGKILSFFQLSTIICAQVPSTADVENVIILSEKCQSYLSTLNLNGLRLLKFYKLNIGKANQTANLFYPKIFDSITKYTSQFFKTSIGWSNSAALHHEHAVQLWADMQEYPIDSLINHRNLITLLKEFNFIFITIEHEIRSTKGYWSLIRNGMENQDSFIRKVSIAVLKANLAKFESDSKDGKCENFDNNWKLIFDLFEAMEGFVSHILKSIWPRVEALFDHVRQYPDNTTPNFSDFNLDTPLPSGTFIDPSVILNDFRLWLVVLLSRGVSHMNTKLQKYITKYICDRDYLTTNLQEFIFDKIFIFLNSGPMYKMSVSVNSEFPPNVQKIIDCYVKYFTQESMDVQGDLTLLLKTLATKVTIPRGRRAFARVLASVQIQTGFLKQDLLKYVTEFEQHRDVLNVLNWHLDVSSLESYDTIFYLFGKMPNAFFSSQVSGAMPIDKAQIKVCFNLVAQLKDLNKHIERMLRDQFDTKAQLAMDEGKDEYMVKMKGVCNFIVLLSHQEEFLEQVFEPLFMSFIEPLSQVFKSTFLSQSLIEEKKELYIYFLSNTFSLAETGLKKVLATHFEYLASDLLTSLNDHLYLISQQDTMTDASMKDKLLTQDSNWPAYMDLIRIVIDIYLIYGNKSIDIFEKLLKLSSINVTKSLQAAQEDPNYLALSYTNTHVLAFNSEILSTALEKINHSIEECIKRQQQYFFIPEVIFNQAKDLLVYMQKAQYLQKPSEDVKEAVIYIDNYTQLAQRFLKSQWAIISSILKIAKFDEDLKNYVALSSNDILDNVLDVLDSSTPEMKRYLLLSLELSFIKAITERLQANEVAYEAASQLIVDVLKQCWKELTEHQKYFCKDSLQIFMRIAFDPTILSLMSQNYHEHFDYLTELLEQIYKHGMLFKSYLRASLHQIMIVLAEHPQLVKGLEHSIINIAISYEMRGEEVARELDWPTMMIPRLYEDKVHMSAEQLDEYGAFCRVVMLSTMENLIQYNQTLAGKPEHQYEFESFNEGVENMILMILKQIHLRKNNKHLMLYNDMHRREVRSCQLLMILSKHLNPAIYTPEYRHSNGRADIVAEINKHVWDILQNPTLLSIKQYLEMFCTIFSRNFPESTIDDHLLPILTNYNCKVQQSTSILLICGSVMLTVDSDIMLKQRVFHAYMAYSQSQSAILRATCQYFLMKVCDDPKFESFVSGLVKDTIIMYLKTVKDCTRVYKKLCGQFDQYNRVIDNPSVEHITNCKFDDFGEFLDTPFAEKIKMTIAKELGQIREQHEAPVIKEKAWKEAIKQLKEDHPDWYEKPDGQITVADQEDNFQKKIQPWEDFEDVTKENALEFMEQKRHDIIMVASLIDKVPNLAGLSRTCEIFNATSLIIPNLRVTTSDEFKGISMTSESWLDIQEVTERDLYMYLEHQKVNGYHILGLEQTSQSEQLNEFNFPDKVVLLLGKEKEGIPQEYYGLLESCIEIPQFGVVRSLNVHVSGAICIWEYTKQQIERKEKAKLALKQE